MSAQTVEALAEDIAARIVDDTEQVAAWVSEYLALLRACRTVVATWDTPGGRVLVAADIRRLADLCQLADDIGNEV